MKKIFNCILILLLTILIIPNVYASNNISLKSITLVEQSDDLLEFYSPKIDGINISFDLSFINVGDYAKYKIVLNNKSNRDYYYDDENKTINTEYISYKYEFENNNKTIKANSDSIIYITVKYIKEVPQNKIVNGIFESESQSRINLSDIILTNPNTYSNIILLIIIFLVLVTSTIIKLKKKQKTGINIILIGLLLIPITTHALEKITITTTAKVTIEEQRNIIESRYINGDINIERGIWEEYSYIQTITFDNKIEEPDNYAYKLDISEEKNNSIIAYFIRVPNSSYYDVHIMSNGYIYANKDSSYMFYNLYSLSEINNIQNLKTNYVENMSYMFHLLPSIEEIDASSFNTSNVTDMSYMFCEKDFFGSSFIDRIIVSEFDTSKVTNMSNMFSGYAGEELDVSSFNTSNVTDMSYMFSFTRFLKSIDLSSFDTSNVTNMNGMFSYMQSLESIDLKYLNTRKITQMSNMFSNYDGVDLDFSNFDTSNVIDMSYMFFNAKLDSINLSSFDTKSVENMSYMFCQCDNLTDLDISSFNTSNVTNMSHMFDMCNSLTTLDLSNFDTSNTTTMNNMFSSMGKIENLNLSSFDTSNVTNFEGMFSHAFYYTNEKKLELDISSFDTHNAINMNRMFENCSQLETIYVGINWDVTNVNTSYSMFNSDSKLPNFNPNVTDKTNANTSDTGYLTLKS